VSVTSELHHTKLPSSRLWALGEGEDGAGLLHPGPGWKEDRIEAQQLDALLQAFPGCAQPDVRAGIDPLKNDRAHSGRGGGQARYLKNLLPPEKWRK